MAVSRHVDAAEPGLPLSPNTTFINGNVMPAPMDASTPAAYATKSHVVA